MSLCECGCGKPAPLARQTRADRGQRQGEPVKYIKGHGKHLDEETLRRLYVDEELCGKEIGERLGVSKSTVWRALDRYGIPRRSRAEWVLLWNQRPPVDVERAAEMYERGFSIPQVATALGENRSAVRHALKRHGVVPRTRAEAARLRRNVAERKYPRPSDLRGLPECAICGSQRSVEWHHLNGNPADDDPGNLMAFCWEHHMFIEYLVGQALLGLQERELVRLCA